MKRLTVILMILLASLLLSACTTGSTTSSWPGLAADKDNAYMANGQYLYAVRLSDGAKVWQFPTQAGTEEFFSNPVVTPDGQILVGSSGRDYALYSVDAHTGQQKWSKPFTATDHFVASPLVVGNTVYAPNNNGTLYALDLATGNLSWSVPLSHSLWGTPSTDGKLIFVSSLDHFVYAVDPNSHKLAWKRDLGGSVPGTPLVGSDGSSLYIGSFARKFYAIDPAKGAVRWSVDLKDWIWSTPALMGDTLYAADISGNLYSLASSNGKNGWPAVKPDGSVTATPLVLSNGIVVVTESGFLYGYKPDGSTLWPPVNIGGKIYTTPVLAGDRILIAPMGAPHWLFAVSSKDGSVLPWSFDGK